MTDVPSKPTRKWQYRNMQCRLYRLGDITLIGYVRVADEWIEVFETDDVVGRDMETVVQIVEDEADEIIESAIDAARDDDDTTNTWPFDDFEPDNPGVDPSPITDPGPNPRPDPYDPNPEYPREPWDSPIWMRSWSDITGTDNDDVVLFRNGSKIYI